MKLSYYQYEVSSVCYMLQVNATLNVAFSIVRSPCCHVTSPSASIAMTHIGLYMLYRSECFLIFAVPHVSLLSQWWEKLLVNLTVLGVVLLILYGAFNQAVKVPAILNSFLI